MKGRFVWHELMTTDVKGAIAFYGDVIGWKTEPFKDGGPEPYNMWVASQGPLGGVMKLPEEAKKMGAPPHWFAHVEVDDVDAAAELVKRKGGKIHHGPTDIPKVGRFAIIADPQGASLSLFRPAPSEGGWKEHDNSKPGEFAWNELMTSDAKAALAFYGELFGWKVLQEHDMGPMGTYFIYGQGNKQYGGMMTKTPDMKMPPSWIHYIQVDDVDAAAKRATQKGAKLMNGPMDVPGGTRIAQLTDPQGAFFALHGPGKPAKK